MRKGLGFRRARSTDDFDTTDGRELRVVNLPPCTVLRCALARRRPRLAFVKLSRGDYYLWEFTDEKAELPVRAQARSLQSAFRRR